MQDKYRIQDTVSSSKIQSETALFKLDNSIAKNTAFFWILSKSARQRVTDNLWNTLLHSTESVS